MIKYMAYMADKDIAETQGILLLQLFNHGIKQWPGLFSPHFLKVEFKILSIRIYLKSTNLLELNSLIKPLRVSSLLKYTEGR